MFKNLIIIGFLILSCFVSLFADELSTAKMNKIYELRIKAIKIIFEKYPPMFAGTRSPKLKEKEKNFREKIFNQLKEFEISVNLFNDMDMIINYNPIWDTTEDEEIVYILEHPLEEYLTIYDI